MSLSEVRSSTKSNYIGKYNYKNSTLVELLDISKDEMEYLSSMVTEDVKYERNNERRKRNRRNEDGLTKREAKKRANLIEVLKGTEDKISTKEIAETLGISDRMVRKYKKELENNESLRSELLEIINKEKGKVEVAVEYNYQEDELFEQFDIDEVTSEDPELLAPIQYDEKIEVVEKPVVEDVSAPAVPTEPAQSGRQVSVNATAYSRNQPSLSNHTFLGIDLRDNPMVIAVDPSVIPLWSLVEVPGYGIYLAGDTGSAIVGNRIDIHMENLNSAWAFGRRQLTVTVLN